MNDLINRGILSSQKGGGTYVNDIQLGQKGTNSYNGFISNINRMSGFTSNLNRAGQSTKNEILNISIIDCDKFLGEAMSLNIGAPVVSIHRLRKVNDIPVSIEKSYINKALCPELDFLNDFNDTTSLYGFIINKGGVQLFHASENIFAVTVSQEIANLLELTEKIPVLYIKRKLFTREGETIEYCEIHCRPDRYMWSVYYVSQ